MLDHVSIGVADLSRAKAFYDVAMPALGHRMLYEDASSLGYGSDSIGLWVLQSARPVKPDLASGLHFCFAAPDRAGVDSFHAAALAAGGTSNGAPGLRADYGENYYAAFVIDPDGYRLEAYFHKAAD
ncbi:VOC family protein [Mesorhizobium xinjiangense]|uniref:VOC family protein n=1 Tax=Mesorhizobium xinjiangense TaxID=2678685 RepID=UPI0012EEAA19|nr:VOC family protein [Mesorhizobium xinjiangense]